MPTNKTLDALHTEVERLVAVWQGRLQLNNWKFTIKWEPIEDTVAETTPDDMYDYATIKFNDQVLLGKPADYVEKTVIHELLHLHDRDRAAMFNEIEGNLSPDVYRFFERVIYQQTEGFVDRMASCFYDLAHAEV
jgi:predicted metal-dependent hydrolase